MKCMPLTYCTPLERGLNAGSWVHTYSSHCVEIRNCRDAFREPAIDTDRLGDVVPACEFPCTSALSEQRSNGNACSIVGNTPRSTAKQPEHKLQFFCLFLGCEAPCEWWPVLGQVEQVSWLHCKRVFQKLCPKGGRSTKHTVTNPFLFTVDLHRT